MRLAITGATGFVGATLLRLALADGHSVAALTRREQPAQEGVRWIDGALDDTAALGRLVESAEAVIHVAGVVNARDRAGFAAGNIAGTRAMLAAAEAAGVRHFVHVSSLSAREPALSNYGWSKAEAEHAVEASPLASAIVRPPAIYGPGDMEMLDLFRFAKRHLALLPPSGRLSVIEVGDLARLLLALATRGAQGSFDADDGTPGGWTHREFAHAIGAALDRKLLAVALPQTLVRAGATLDRLLRGDGAKLTPDRAAYFCHPDWVIDPARRPAPGLWTPAIDTPAGLAATARWYEERGLL